MDVTVKVNLQDLKALLATMDDGRTAQAQDMLATLVDKHEEAFGLRVARAAERAHADNNEDVCVCKPGDSQFKIDDKGSYLWITAWLRVERSDLED